MRVVLSLKRPRRRHLRSGHPAHRVIRDDGMVETRYVYDGHNLILETDDLLVSEADYTYAPQAYGNLISQHQLYESTFFHFDGLRNTSEITDEVETITDDRRYSAFGKDPASAPSRKQARLRVEELAEVCRQVVSEEFLPRLAQDFSEQLGQPSEQWLELDAEDRDGQTILFHFPAGVERRDVSYVQPVVRLEFGARSDHWPAETAFLGDPARLRAIFRLDWPGLS